MNQPSKSSQARVFGVHLFCAVLVIAVTTEALRIFQLWLMRVEDVPLRAYTIGFLLPLAVIAHGMGRRIAFASLTLAVILSAYFLMPPSGLRMENVSDGASLLFLMTTGGILIQSIATADANRRLRDEAQSRARQQEALARIARLARSSANDSDIRSLVAEIVGNALQADRCYFGLFDKEEGRIAGEWRRDGLPGLTGSPVLPAYNDTIRRYEATGKTVVVTDTREDAVFGRAAAIFDGLAIRSFVRVPVLRDGAVVSVLAAAMAYEPRRWSETEIDFLEVTAAETRAAVEAAHDYLREKTIATTLQRVLLPRRTPHASGLDVYVFYRAALEEANIGGDFADAFELGDDRSALVLGDVSGKGLPAASQIAVIRNMLRYVLYGEDCLSGSIRSLNAVLTDRRLLSGFVTLFVGIYDRSRSTLTYVSCGHEPALLQDGGGGIRRLMPTGMVLGALSEAEYEQETVSMSAGDMLLLYTDGASEAGPDRRSQLGIDGISRLLASASDDADARERVMHVSAGVRAAAEGRLHDDVCILGALAPPGPAR